MQSKKSTEAIQIFDSVAAGYENKYKDKNTKFYSARSPAETLFYTLDAANSNKGSATVVSGNWGYAYYLKAYALLDLGRVSEAKVQLQRAVTLSPQNSQFLSELGHVYQLEKNWQSALQIFQRAEAAAKRILANQRAERRARQSMAGNGLRLRRAEPPRRRRSHVSQVSRAR